jgi:hypothetical protein
MGEQQLAVGEAAYWGMQFFSAVSFISSQMGPEASN